MKHKTKDTCRVPEGETPITYQDLWTLLFVVAITTGIAFGGYVLFSFFLDDDGYAVEETVGGEITIYSNPAAEDRIIYVGDVEGAYEYPTSEYIGSCKTKVEGWDSGFAVYRTTEDISSYSGKTLGFFSPTGDGDTPAIVLRDVTLDTIAHEVYHYVEYVRTWLHLDEENSADYQGYFTQCAYELVRGV